MSKAKPAQYQDPFPGEDPRYFAIDRLHAGQEVRLATSERVDGKLIHLAFPSLSAVMLHTARRHHQSSLQFDLSKKLKQTDQGYEFLKDSELFDFINDRTLHIIASFTAIESFANLIIPDGHEVRIERQDKKCVEIYNKDQIERNLSLDVKLDKVLPGFTGVASPKGGQLWNKYDALKKVRDRLIHLKSVDARSSDPQDETIWGTLLKTRSIDYSQAAHDLIVHFKGANPSRWMQLYPY